MLAAVLAWQLVGLVGWYFVVMQGTKIGTWFGPPCPIRCCWPAPRGDQRTGWLSGALGIGGGGRPVSGQRSDPGLRPVGGHFSHQTEAVWLTYGPGQMLIVFSALSIVALLGRGRTD
jgi:hypothetical protein